MLKKISYMLTVSILALGALLQHPQATHAALNAICQFKQQRMPCSVVNKNGWWTIAWQDGITEKYKELSRGRLQDKRGGIWTIYSRQKHTYLEHSNGNVIDIFY
jgi:hypothetical protein